MDRWAISITNVPAARPNVLETAGSDRLTTWVIMAAVLFGAAFLRFWQIEAVGVAPIGLVCLLADTLYGRKSAIVAALAMAFMPYHVVVGRQVLLDGPQ